MVTKNALDLALEKHRLDVICHFDRTIGQLYSKLRTAGVNELLAKIENIPLETSPEKAVSSDVNVTLLEIIKLASYEHLRLYCNEAGLRLKIELKNIPIPNEGLVWPTLMITVSKTKKT